MKRRILLVADVSNLYYCINSRFNGARLDYRRLYDAAQTQGEIFRAIAYGAEMEGAASKFKTVLQGIGFEINYKEPKIYMNDGGRQTRKADWDVGIAMDIVKILDSVDLVILGTADGDMTPCAEFIKSRGKLVHVFGCGISRELREACHRWVEVDESYLEIKAVA